MSDIVIQVENLSKHYRIGVVGTGTLSRDLSRWWAKLHGKPDPTLKVDHTTTKQLSVNKSTSKSKTETHNIQQITDNAFLSSEYIWALKDISFEVKQGEILGIIGRNGAGKSTLLKILSRVTAPTSGECRIKGRIASLLEVGTGFHPELTGRENIFLNGAILGMTKEEIREKFEEIVSFSEVGKYINTPVKRYSSGMYVRLAFAVAAHLEPEILFVDEVLAVGDTSFQKKCLGKMGEVAKQGRTVLFVSHNMGTINALCNKSILLEDGKITSYDKTSNVIAKYNNVANKLETVEIGSQMRNRGDGSITFKSCSLFDKNGEPKVAFFIGEDIRVEINLVSALSGKMSFWLIIFDSTGVPLLSTHQRDVELMEIVPGKYKLTYKTEGLGLMPGTYTITAGAFDPKLKFLEWIDGCQTFEVYPCFINGGAFDGRWGQINQKATWDLVKI